MNPLPPDFDDLVGTDVEASERARMRRVHDLLVAAGPPPELSSLVAPLTSTVVPRARRRRARLLAVAAALGAVSFVVGILVANSGGPTTDRVIAMSGPGAANASLAIFEVDDAGNWPMELEVEGLGPPAGGGLYQLWLTKDGNLAALCGSFLAEPDGTTAVPMNAPWKLNEFDGWVVVEQGSTTPVLTT